MALTPHIQRLPTPTVPVGKAALNRGGVVRFHVDDLGRAGITGSAAVLIDFTTMTLAVTPPVEGGRIYTVVQGKGRQTRSLQLKGPLHALGVDINRALGRYAVEVVDGRSVRINLPLDACQRGATAGGQSGLRRVLDRIVCDDWKFRVGAMGEGCFLQVAFTDRQGRPWRGRKWYVSRHAGDGEIVQTALKAILTAVEHEVRESFLFDGKAIFHPHHSIESLLAIADRIEHRPVSPTTEGHE